MSDAKEMFHTDADAYKDIENEYNSMLKELNDKLYAKYKNKLNQV